MQVKKSYSKSELAEKYGVCVLTFTRRYMAPVLTKLRKTGYDPSKRTRILTPRQVQIIVDHVGDFEE